MQLLSIYLVALNSEAVTVSYSVIKIQVVCVGLKKQNTVWVQYGTFKTNEVLFWVWTFGGMHTSSDILKKKSLTITKR